MLLTPEPCWLLNALQTVLMTRRWWHCLLYRDPYNWGGVEAAAPPAAALEGAGAAAAEEGQQEDEDAALAAGNNAPRVRCPFLVTGWV